MPIVCSCCMCPLGLRELGSRGLRSTVHAAGVESCPSSCSSCGEEHGLRMAAWVQALIHSVNLASSLPCASVPCLDWGSGSCLVLAELAAVVGVKPVGVRVWEARGGAEPLTACPLLSP